MKKRFAVIAAGLSLTGGVIQSGKIVLKTADVPIAGQLLTVSACEPVSNHSLWEVALIRPIPMSGSKTSLTHGIPSGR